MLTIICEREFITKFSIYNTQIIRQILQINLKKILLNTVDKYLFDFHLH